MRFRLKSVSSCLGLATLAGAGALLASSWDISGRATAQEAVLQNANAPEASPRDVRQQPLAVAVPGAEAPADERETSSGIVTVDPSARLPGARSPNETAENETVRVMVDHAKVVRLPDRTQTVIVGNPMIADITVQRNGILVVTGKAYGATNLIALDAAGVLLAESTISVQAPTDAVVTVQRGLSRESYSCTPTCQPSLRLGDSPEYFGGVGNQTTQRNSLATQR
jgi:Flp pilus assembly secretin CpaC